jgi:dTMP kinase
LHGLEAIAVGPTRPDLTLVFDLPVELGLARADARRAARGEHPDRFEAEDDAYHVSIRDAFLAIAAAEPERCAIIDASGTPDAVEAQVMAAVEARLALVGQGGGV